MSREMTAEYQRDVGDFVRQNVIACFSSLVSDVMVLVQNADHQTLQNTSFDYEELTNLVQRRDWETPGIEKTHKMDRDELLAELERLGAEDERDAHQRAEVASHHAAENDLSIEGWSHWWEAFLGVSDGELQSKLADAVESEADGWKDFCGEHNLDCEYDDVYEHWAVDRWFAARLEEHGEVVGDFGGFKVWGRCTTGQSISMDYVVRQIYNELHKEPA